MLLRFSVSNFGSLRDKQELSMIASNAIKDEPAGLIDTPELRNEKILPAAVIYGANASGKSNFVKAMAHMRGLVRNSHRQGEPGGPVPLNPFLLDPVYAEKPSTFYIDFIWSDARYSYGFEATGKEFAAESLYVWRGSHRSLLFERKRQTFEFGRSLKGRNKIIEDLTRPNSLFLSAAVQNNHEELTEIANFFSSTRINLAYPMPAGVISARLADQGVDKKILNLLHEIDIGVTDARVHETPIDQKDKEIELRNAVLAVLQQRTGTPPQLEVKSKFIELGHQTTDGKTVFLDLEDESAGTVQLLYILGPIFRALGEGRVVVIDEFGSRLHTRASEIILSLFNNKETNPKGAQLIVATHDTNLLNAKGLRRDQVWFTEKDETGATHLYPLTDIETRKGDKLEKGYLQGRYGAIPFAGSIANLVKAG